MDEDEDNIALFDGCFQRRTNVFPRGDCVHIHGCAARAEMSVQASRYTIGL
jgi:hypothetical protein